MTMDVAYQHGPFEANPELRYSLRSIAANLPHRRVVIAGYRPAWVDPDTTRHLHVVQRPGEKHRNALANLYAIAACANLTDDVVVLNDDHHVTRPIDAVPTLHCGPLAEVVEARFRTSPDRHALGLADTLTLLRRLGIADPLCYDLHAPGVVNRAALADTLATIRRRSQGLHRYAILWRTVYGNLHDIGGQLWHDVKVRDRLTDDLDGPFVSTDDVTWEFGAVGAALRETFPAQCRYERTQKGAP